MELLFDAAHMEDDVLEGVNGTDKRQRDDEEDEEDSLDESIIPPKIFKCENQFCKDFNKIFDFAAQKVKHDK